MPGLIRVGVGGWTYEPWRGVFYPADLPQKRELEFASRALTSIEINGTYYSTFKPDSWRKWRDETPEGFKLSIKASRYCTNRKVLAEMGASMERFLAQGLTELGDKLGPINWEFATTKKFDAEDFGAFLGLLPKTQDGVALRHAVEVRHPSFAVPEFYELARRHGVAIVYALGESYPEIEEATADFTYARMMMTREDVETGLTGEGCKSVAAKARRWAKRGDAYVYFISGGKLRNPAAAQMLIRELAGRRR